MIILTCIPPLSSLPAIPSTSSIISTCFLGSALWPDKAQRVQLQGNCRITFPYAFLFQTLHQVSQKALAPVSNKFPKFPLSSPPFHSKVGGLLFPTGSSNSGTTLGSLSSDVFEQRMSTGSETFSLLISLDATVFVLLSVLILIETICPKICSKSRLKSAKSPLQVDVRRSKTSLLKLPIAWSEWGEGKPYFLLFKLANH